MKIALVYDRINKYGGAERVLEALHDLWPDAPVYTAVYDPVRTPWTAGWDIRPSFLARLPFRSHEYLPWIMPLAFESMNLDGFDVVISITSAEAKAILTKPGTVHICYCLTPTRYLWSGYEEYLREPGYGILSAVMAWMLRRSAPVLRKWDLVAAARPDRMIAISGTVKARIRMYYKRPVDGIIFPPVDTAVFDPERNIPVPVIDAWVKAHAGRYCLVVSRLVGYKRIDQIIRAALRLNQPLLIVGRGKDESRLRKLGGPGVHFLNRHLTQEELVYYYSQCRALISAGHEDFGLSAAECQAMGKPVIGLEDSGISDIVVDGRTGVLYREATVDGLCGAITRLGLLHIDPHLCRKQGQRFDKKVFKTAFQQVIHTARQGVKGVN